MNLEELMNDVRKASDGMQKALEGRWPINSRVQVVLSYRQINTSSGTVLGHDGKSGTVRVSIDRKPHPSGRYQSPFVRDIYYKDMR